MKSCRVALLFLALIALVPAAATAATITFEGLPEGALTNQFAGLTFSNAYILTAGLSLNEIEFPPRSGSNVAFVQGGPMMGISFAAPVAYVGGYFTRIGAVTITAYGAGNALLGSVTSPSFSNYVSSGNPPNALLALGITGIESVTIGSGAQGLFVLDDLVYGDRPDAPVPEPGSLLLLGTGLAGLAARRRRKNQHLAGRLTTRDTPTP